MNDRKLVRHIIHWGIASILLASALELKADNGRDCLWGTQKEVTTWQRPYNEIMAKEIPVLKDGLGTKKEVPEYERAISPETAIAVRTSDGNCYAYYYKKVTRYRLRYEYVPADGMPCNFSLSSLIAEPTTQSFYEPYTVLQKIIIPCEPGSVPCQQAQSQPKITVPPVAPVPSETQKPGSASVHFRTEVTQ